MDRRKLKLDTTPDNIFSALETIEKWQGDNITQCVDSVYVDYLQKFIPVGNNFVEFYGKTTNLIKDWAKKLMTRTVLGIQAKREVDDRKVQIPMMEDGQWTSSIESFSDGVLSVVRPSHYRKEGEEFGGVVVTGRNQMLVSCLKRKLGPADFNGWVNFQPEYNKLDELELRNFKPNED